MNKWIRTKPYEIKVPFYGLYSVTTSNGRKIFTIANGSTETISKTTNALMRDEKILTVGKESYERN